MCPNVRCDMVKNFEVGFKRALFSLTYTFDVFVLEHVLS